MDALSGLIDQRVRDLGGWRGETLARMRAVPSAMTGSSLGSESDAS